jgi:hypothetical protein
MREVNRDNSETAWERAKAHYRIIQEHAFASICIAVPLRPIAQAVDDFGLPPWMKNPYYLAWKGILSVYMGYNKKVGLNTPIDFIFDDQTEKKKVLAAWDTLYQNTPQRYKRFIPNMPTFRSDDDFLPLQAATLSRGG